MRHLLFLFLGTAALVMLLQEWVSAPTPVRPNNDELDEDQGEREHIHGEGCWCHPTLFFDGGDEFGDVWCHKSPGDELPPSSVLAAAIAAAMRPED
jgi:hypothetical protein